MDKGIEMLYISKYCKYKFLNWPDKNGRVFFFYVYVDSVLGDWHLLLCIRSQEYVVPRNKWKDILKWGRY